MGSEESSTRPKYIAPHLSSKFAQMRRELRGGQLGIRPDKAVLRIPSDHRHSPMRRFPSRPTCIDAGGRTRRVRRGIGRRMPMTRSCGTQEGIAWGSIPWPSAVNVPLR